MYQSIYFQLLIAFVYRFPATLWALFLITANFLSSYNASKICWVLKAFDNRNGTSLLQMTMYAETKRKVESLAP